MVTTSKFFRSRKLKEIHQCRTAEEVHGITTGAPMDFDTTRNIAGRPSVMDPSTGTSATSMRPSCFKCSWVSS